MRESHIILGSVLVAAVFGCGSGKSASSPDGATGDGGGGGGGGGGAHESSTHGGASSSRGGTSTSSSAPPVGASVLMMHNHINRDGAFVDSLLTESAAATFASDPSFSGKVSGDVYASPLYVESGVKGKGTFYVATEDGTVYALDETTGNEDWHKNVGTAASQTGSCGNIGPIGITGTPAIDLATRLIVFGSATADGNGNIATHSIYALSIDTGDLAWTVDVSKLTYNGIDFAPQTQNQRGAVLILDSVAYVPYGGNDGDCSPYHGWVVGVPLSGKGARAWATTVGGAGIWGSGGPASDGTSIFVTTGNGIGDTSTWGESEGLFRLSPGPTFSGDTKDYFALYDWMQADSDDLDLSGSGPLIIDAPSMTPSALALGQGKDGNVYLVDRADLGGIATMKKPANVGSLTLFGNGGEISNAGAWATVGDTTYVVVRPNGQSQASACPKGMQGELVAFKLDPTSANKMSVVWCASSAGNGSPSITTTDGTHDALVWVFAAEGASELFAWDLATGKKVLTQGATASNVRHFTTPIAVHGRMFVGGDGQLYAFKAK